MLPHKARTHAPWAASSMTRLMTCTAAFQAQQGLREPAEGHAAAWGTVCHDVAERSMRAGIRCEAFIGRDFRTERHTIRIDGELAACAQFYVDHVQGLGADESWTETKTSLAALEPAVESGGRADWAGWFAATRTLEIVDLKTGRMIVIPGDQLKTYALGFMLAHPHLRPKTVRLTICQPRVEHEDGYIRSVDIDVVELLDWSEDVLRAMREAMSEARRFVTGSHCQWCPVAPTCPALREKALAVASASFEDLTPALDPKDMSAAALARVLDNADLLTGWLNSVRAHAQRLAERGTAIPGYTLVEKRKNRVWKDETLVAGRLRTLGLADDTIFPRKLLSPAQAEKALGKPAAKVIENMWDTPSTGEANLVREDRSERVGAAPRKVLSTLAERHFDLLT